MGKRQRLIAEMALKRWTNQKLSAAFNSWYGWLLDIINQREAAQRALSRWANQKLSGAWNQWMDQLRLSERDVAARNMLLKWQKNCLWSAISTWANNHCWEVDTEHTVTKSPTYAEEWHKIHHLARVFVPWRVGAHLR